MTWYTTALDCCRRIAMRTGLAVTAVAAVVAATSPRSTWSLNLGIAWAICRSWGDGHPMRPRGCTRRSYYKALSCLEFGADALTGPKENAFYAAIIGHEEAIVIDTHVARALGIRGDLTRPRYARIEARFRTWCAALRLVPRDAQVAIWTKQRGKAA